MSASTYAVCANDTVVPYMCAGQDGGANSDPRSFTDNDRASWLVRLLHYWHVRMRKAVVIVTDENTFGYENIVFQYDRTRARDKRKAADLVFTSNFYVRLILVISRIEIVSVLRINIIHQKTKIDKCIDMTPFANCGDVADNNILRIQNPIRRQYLSVCAEVREQGLILAGQRRGLLQQCIRVFNRGSIRH